MTQTVIPEGFRVIISSWENDGDASQTKIVQGLSEARVKFLIEACSLFRSRSRGKGCYGNMYEPSDKEIKQACTAFAKVMLKHTAVLDKEELEILLSKDKDVLQDFVGEFMGDLLGYSEGYWVRVFDGVKVEYTPVQIFIQDVTSRFI